MCIYSSWTLSLSSNTPFEDRSEDLALISRIEGNLFREIPFTNDFAGNLLAI